MKTHWPYERLTNNLQWLLLLSVLTIGILPAYGDALQPQTQYVCPPCYHVDDIFDTEVHHKGGKCSVCGMQLIALDTAPDCGAPAMRQGSGNFCFTTARGDQLSVFYHTPKSLQADSPVLVVLPGAGRNAWAYRDAWVTLSEQYGVVIVSPYYAEHRYPGFWSYNLAGMIKDVKINAEKTAMKSFNRVTEESQWLFTDFDALFDVTVSALGLQTKTYDMFGHSAGGQIIHRYAMFHTANKANRMVAANAGWYTTPDFSIAFPYGLNNSGLTQGAMPAALGRNLVLLLGELDNARETRGHLVRNAQVDGQGTNRFDRGQYFMRGAAALAGQLNTALQWRIKQVPGVGHDYRKMGQSAAAYLYGE
jgi:pimeloyl-ACP methyl ester carboxylesterase